MSGDVPQPHSPETSREAGPAVAALNRRIAKLERINAVLIDRVERAMEHQVNAYSLFQTAIGLETQVRARTEELNAAMSRLERLNQELTRARDAAEQASRFKTRFFTALGHDLLQPLHAARLSMSALTDGGHPGPDQHLLKQIDLSLTSVEELLRTILDLSRLETGIIKPDLRVIDLGELFAMVAGGIEPLVRAKGLVLRVRPSADTVLSDPLMLRRILQNLLANAVQYTSSGQVMLSARRRSTRVRIEVWDTGPGISKDEQTLIFEEFQRGSTSHGARVGGFGLGLSISQRMTAALGHELTVCSKPEHGSCFMLAAPYAGPASDLPEPAAAASPAAAYDFSGIRVVLIENDANVTEAMRALLEKWSCQVSATTGLHDLAPMVADAQSRPAIVIADYHLDHGQSGLACVSHMRAVYGPNLPAIVVTADHSAATAAAVRGAGCELLCKPVRPAELRALLQYLLS